VVLEMAPGAAVPVSEPADEGKAPAASVKAQAKAKGKAKSGATPPQSKKPIEMGHPAAVNHLQSSFDVHAKTSTQVGPP